MVTAGMHVTQHIDRPAWAGLRRDDRKILIPLSPGSAAASSSTDRNVFPCTDPLTNVATAWSGLSRGAHRASVTLSYFAILSIAIIRLTIFGNVYACTGECPDTP